MSADILTQLQTCYDQLLRQFFSTVSYLSQRHPLVAPNPVAGDPYTLPPQLTNTGDNTAALSSTQTSLKQPSQSQSQSQPLILPGPEDTDTEQNPYPLRPDSPQRFAAAQQELADDLVRKGQQIEHLISQLPGIGKDEAEQAEQIRELVEKVKIMEEARREKRRELRACARRLEEVMHGMSTSIDYDAI